MTNNFSTCVARNAATNTASTFWPPRGSGFDGTAPTFQLQRSRIYARKHGMLRNFAIRLSLPRENALAR
jgi:hypothetical protein